MGTSELDHSELLDSIDELHLDEAAILRQRRDNIEQKYGERRQLALEMGTKKEQRTLDALGEVINSHLQGDAPERGAVLFVEQAMHLEKSHLRSGVSRSAEVGGWQSREAQTWKEEMEAIADNIRLKTEMLKDEVEHSGDLSLLPQADMLNFALNYAKQTRLNDTSHEANTEGRLEVLKNALGAPSKNKRSA